MIQNKTLFLILFFLVWCNKLLYFFNVINRQYCNETSFITANRIPFTKILSSYISTKGLNWRGNLDPVYPLGTNWHPSTISPRRWVPKDTLVGCLSALDQCVGTNSNPWPFSTKSTLTKVNWAFAGWGL